jgi:hypothetical protein
MHKLPNPWYEHTAFLSAIYNLMCAYPIHGSFGFAFQGKFEDSDVTHHGVWHWSERRYEVID